MVRCNWRPCEDLWRSPDVAGRGGSESGIVDGLCQGEGGLNDPMSMEYKYAQMNCDGVDLAHSVRGRPVLKAFLCSNASTTIDDYSYLSNIRSQSLLLTLHLPQRAHDTAQTAQRGNSRYALNPEQETRGTTRIPSFSQVLFNGLEGSWDDMDLRMRAGNGRSRALDHPSRAAAGTAGIP